MLTIGSTVLGVDNLDRAIEFWSAALDYTPREDHDDTWVILVPKQGVPAHAAGAQLALALSQTPVQAHPRVHLDLYAADQSAEVERLVALGAQIVDWDMYPEEPGFVVLADPAGNRFCVIDKSAAS